MPTFKKNTSPAMKRSGFKMKSGNTPLFKHIGNSPSPITTDSPLYQDEDAKRLLESNLEKQKKLTRLQIEADRKFIEDEAAKIKPMNPQEIEEKEKTAKKAKLGKAGRNLAEIFMGGIHNAYGNPNKTTKTSELDEEKAYKRWAKEKSDKETMTLAQQIIADDKKKSQIKKA